MFLFLFIVSAFKWFDAINSLGIQQMKCEGKYPGHFTMIVGDSAFSHGSNSVNYLIGPQEDVPNVVQNVVQNGEQNVVDRVMQRSRTPIVFNESVCHSVPQFNQKLRQHIKNISTVAQKIIDFVIKGDDRGVTYQELATFVDKFGSRLSGTPNLEKSIDYMVELLIKERHDKVYTETVTVPQWTRGKERAEMIAPRHKPMNILALGYSVGTNGTVLTADVIVVKTFDELKHRSREAKGKFVVYNFDFTSYDEQVAYRMYGASIAAKYGAVGALIRSLTPFSIDSPHTGYMVYNDTTVPKIPAISITVEDAELFHRIFLKGERIRVSLYMEATNGADRRSRNTISEITGIESPEEIVLVSGHLDSWDVGQGAMDDGGGAFISWRALSVIKKLGLQPKRTMRSVLWTGEEFGLIEAQAYAKRHSNETNRMSIAMESDIGTFTPLGISFSGTNPTALCIVNEILKSLKPINASRLTISPIDVSDVETLMALGVPGSSLENINDKYFYFHHTNGDTMTVLNSTQLDLCTAVWAVTSYAFASLDQMLPR